MAETSKIQWTHATFNPWIGCSKVHAGCTHCYAETLMDTRYGRVQWGPRGSRARTSKSYWKQPHKWNREAESAGERRRVFCASLADVFEDDDDFTYIGFGHGKLADARRDLFDLIDATPWIDWLILTKRPENVPIMVPDGKWHRENVWLGTSPANQKTADASIPHLIQTRGLASVLFLSAEPLIGPMDIREYLPSLDWVIIGGESGVNARPCRKEWVRDLVTQCREFGVPAFVKQLGDAVWSSDEENCNAGRMRGGLGWKYDLKSKGDDPEQWPVDLRVREFPEPQYV